MRDLNIDFMDLYKSVDRFIKDAYASTEGVSEYIRQMEQNDYKGRRYVATWGADYDKLKRLRWIRNQLSHEVGYDEEICEESDYDWLCDFDNRLYSACDPVAVMKKAEQAEIERCREEQRRLQAQKRAEEQRRLQAQRRAEEEKQRQAWLREQQRLDSLANPPQVQQPKKKTLWQRIKDFFSGND